LGRGLGWPSRQHRVAFVKYGECAMRRGRL